MQKSANRPVSFVIVASDHGPMIINRNDFTHGPDGHGYGVGGEILRDSAYSRDELALTVNLLSSLRDARGDGVIALDCGANIGVMTVEWARHMAGWGIVRAFEPQERIFYALAGNIALNNCMNATATLAALGRSASEISIPALDYDTPGSFGSLELRDRGDVALPMGQQPDYTSRAATVPIISVDGLDLNRVDFIKIDVEGMEMEVLAGAEMTIARHRPIVFVEIMREADGIQAFLEERGYTCHTHTGNIVALHEKDPVRKRVFAWR